jgi:hypothetical protein
MRVGFYLILNLEKGTSLKIVGKLLAVFALCATGTTFAQTAPASCTPYSIPIQTTMTDCGPGLLGSKYKTMTKSCPSGEVKESADYDTSGCQIAPSGVGGTVTQAARCRLTPDACANAPIAANCPPGRKWSLKGSGVAHCVDEDPVCPWGTSLNHDFLGNPSCVQNTCPSNQVLQSDGKSCGCSSGLVWSGSSCVPAKPTCQPSDVDDQWGMACPEGPGMRYRRKVTTCPNGPYGAPYEYYYWETSECDTYEPPPPPPPTTCTTSSWSESAECTGGRSGSMSRTVTTSCPGGAYGSPSTSYGSWDESQCSTATVCTPSQSTYGTSCGSGFTGTKYITTYYTCPSGSYQTENDSNCGCANGATNYPTCTPPYQEPAPTPVTPKGCVDAYNDYLPVGTIASNCDVGAGSPYPRGRTYRCTDGGWIQENQGDTNRYMECM